MKNSSSQKETVIRPRDVNANFIGCIDGRLPIYVLKPDKRDNRYGVLHNPHQLETKNYVQVLGAALGFVAVLEESGLDRNIAFILVEEALVQARYMPTFHTDTHFGHHGDLTPELHTLHKTGKTAQLAELVLSNLSGCGFVTHQWGRDAKNYISEAIQRGWQIQVLTGNHNENKGGAHLNYERDKSPSVFEANKKGSPMFNQDMWFVTMILQHIKTVAKKRRIVLPKSFEVEALSWFVATFSAVVVKLNGVQNRSEIQVHES